MILLFQDLELHDTIGKVFVNSGKAVFLMFLLWTTYQLIYLYFTSSTTPRLKDDGYLAPQAFETLERQYQAEQAKKLGYTERKALMSKPQAITYAFKDVAFEWSKSNKELWHDDIFTIWLKDYEDQRLVIEDVDFRSGNSKIWQLRQIERWLNEINEVKNPIRIDSKKILSNYEQLQMVGGRRYDAKNIKHSLTS